MGKKEPKRDVRVGGRGEKAGGRFLTEKDRCQRNRKLAKVG